MGRKSRQGYQRQGDVLIALATSGEGCIGNNRLQLSALCLCSHRRGDGGNQNTESKYHGQDSEEIWFSQLRSPSKLSSYFSYYYLN